jgi:ribosomal protein S21
MTSDKQVRRLMKLIREEETLAMAAAKAGMDEKTARKYRDSSKLPSESRAPHIWRTRPDPIAPEDWEWMREQLSDCSALEAKTLFEALQRKDPGRYADGQLRTFQRRVKVWRALEGPAKEVFFAQRYEPGKLSESDFTHMSSLGVTIAGEPFSHLIYHFVLAYSNWETGTICFSESFENLSAGLQHALWELGGVPEAHRTDRLSTAVHKVEHPEEFTRRYDALLRHYGLRGEKIQAGQPHENGDIEQAHHRFKRSLDQALMLRGSRDFPDRAAYEAFLREHQARCNAGRKERLREELAVLRALPSQRLDADQRVRVLVGQGSTIYVDRNVYSVHSRLIGERVEVYLRCEHLEVWYAQRKIETLPRLRGRGRHRIDYRHVIDWLVRKPGAFENYRYRDGLFPTSRFRMAYDELTARTPSRASREYLAILELAAKETESGVDAALMELLAQERPITGEAVKALVVAGQRPAAVTDVLIAGIDLSVYDALLAETEVLV